MMLAFPAPWVTAEILQISRTSGPISEAEPASAKPKPSSMRLLAKIEHVGGMSSYFVFTINSETYLVRPGALGNSPVVAGTGLTGNSGVALAARAALAAIPAVPRADAAATREFRQKSRRIMRGVPPVFFARISK